MKKFKIFILSFIILSNVIFPQAKVEIKASIRNPIGFNQLNPDTLITTSYTNNDFIILSSDIIATNYGDSLDYRKTSLFTVFDKSNENIRVSSVYNSPFDAISMRVYQVSENRNDSLIIEGWLGNTKKYSKLFVGISAWRTLQLDYGIIDKIVIKSGNVYNNKMNYDYNIGSFYIMTFAGKLIILLEQ